MDFEECVDSDSSFQVKADVHVATFIIIILFTINVMTKLE